jgi:hypothetical protein
MMCVVGLVSFAAWCMALWVRQHTPNSSHIFGAGLEFAICSARRAMINDDSSSSSSYFWWSHLSVRTQYTPRQNNTIDKSDKQALRAKPTPILNIKGFKANK